MKGNWIKLYRKLVKWEWYTHVPTKVLFIHLLLVANHEPEKWRGRTIGRGQVLTSYRMLSKETGLSVRQIRTAISNLKSTHELTQQSTQLNTIITLCNYDTYQTREGGCDTQSDTQSDKRATHERHSNKQEGKEVEEVLKKREREEDPPSAPPRIDYQKIVEQYHGLCPSLPRLAKLTENRKQAIRARLKDWSVNDIEEVFRNAEASPFLSGRSGRWNGCNFDWLLKPTNFPKVLEGTYNDKGSQGTLNYTTVNPETGEEEW
jgi:hypothetical protein